MSVIVKIVRSHDSHFLDDPGLNFVKINKVDHISRGKQ